MTLEQFIQTIQDITTQISLIKDKQKLSSDEKERLQGLEQRKVDTINEYSRQHPNAMRILAFFRGQ